MGKTYACTDLHGMYELWEQIKNYLQKDDTLYFLGDACDRGLDGVRIMQELLDDKRVIYLKGNHEEMAACYMREYFEMEDISSLHMWYGNGGGPTFTSFLSLGHDKGMHLVRRLERLSTKREYVNKDGKNILLCHAGMTPNLPKEISCLKERKIDLLWDRSHFMDPWYGGEYDCVIHGHTPVPYVDKDIDGILEYCGGHKVDLDLGSFETGAAALFDLDALEIKKYFYMEVEDVFNNCINI